MTTISFRPFLPHDAEPCADLFARSIEELTVEDYDDAQRAAWAAAADDPEAFAGRLAGALTILAVAEGELLGFAALKDDPKAKENRIIDMLYVSPDHAGQGIGKALLEVMELLAGQRGAETVTTDASETAYEFFGRLGYEMQARNTVMRGDEWLVNTTMKKKLPARPKADA